MQQDQPPQKPIAERITIVTQKGHLYLRFDEPLSSEDQLEILTFLNNEVKLFKDTPGNYLERAMTVEKDHTLLKISDTEARQWERYVDPNMFQEVSGIGKSAFNTVVKIPKLIIQSWRFLNVCARWGSQKPS